MLINIKDPKTGGCVKGEHNEKTYGNVDAVLWADGEYALNVKLIEKIKMVQNKGIIINKAFGNLKRSFLRMSRGGLSDFEFVGV